MIKFVLLGAVVLGGIQKRWGFEVESIRNDFAREVVDRDGYSLVGEGGGALSSLENVFLAFEKDQAVTAEQARKEFIRLKTQFAKEFNSNKKIRPYLVRFPMEQQSFKLFLFFNDDSECNRVISSEDEILFFYDESLIHRERFDEALELIY